MQIFAVQTIVPGNTQSVFALVAANDPEQALAFAAEQSVAAGKPETSMVAVFDRDEIEALSIAMGQAAEKIEG